MSIPARGPGNTALLRWHLLLAFFIVLCGIYWADTQTAHAQTGTQNSAQSPASAQIPLAPKIKAVASALPAKPAASSSAADTPGGPAWSQLTPVQQQALKPLQSKWSSISEPQKRKWLALVPNYQLRSAAEQATLQSRMTEWASLSVQERAQARLNFAEAGTLTPEEKKAKWEAYQALSAEEKKRLQPVLAAKPAGATTTIKPVPPQKLANVGPAKPRPAPIKPQATAAQTAAGPALAPASATATSTAGASASSAAAVPAAPIADGLAPGATALPAVPVPVTGALPAASTPVN